MMLDIKHISPTMGDSVCEKSVISYLGKYQNDERVGWLISLTDEKKDKLGELRFKAFDSHLNSNRFGHFYFTF